MIMVTLTLINIDKVNASVSNIPYPTFSIGLQGELVNTATAYEGTFILNKGFSSPSDIYIDHMDNVYIADTDNKRIYKYNPNTKEELSIGEDILKYPQGVFVDEEFNIYVADPKLSQVLLFNKDGELLKVYERPDEVLFGEDSAYKPLKVVVDKRKNLYVISESGNNGIIHMDEHGDFHGYYGVNKVNLSLSLYIRRLLMSKEEREKYSPLIPPSTTNMAIDKKGLLYTVTRNDYNTPLRKLNIEGNNVLTGYYIIDPALQDIYVDNNGLIYTVSNNDQHFPIVSVHDKYGNLLFAFGDKIQDSFKIGVFDNPVGVAVDSNGDIWVLDKKASIVQVFTKTEFASMVITAINAYESGNYKLAEDLFEEVVRQNAMFALAHSNLGKIYQKDGRYELALESYRIANNKEGYSDVFWELRDEWIANNLIYLLLSLVLFYILFVLFKKHKEKIKIYHTFREYLNSLKKKKFYHEFAMLKRILKDPLDVVYEIKFRQSIRIRTATLLYVIFVFLHIICDYYVRGYLFRSISVDVVLTYELLKWFIPLLLLGIANHLINSLQSGEGFYRDIFIGIIYATAPVLLFKLPIDIISNVLTYNEKFIFDLANYVIYGWTIINVIIVIKEINNYKVGQLIINLLLTFLTMLIIILLYLIINVLLSQFFTFVEGILQEVF